METTNNFILTEEQSELALSSKEFMEEFMESSIRYYKRTPKVYELGLHIHTNLQTILNKLHEYNIDTQSLIDKSLVLQSKYEMICNYNIFDDRYITYYIPDKQLAIKFVSLRESKIHDKTYWQRESIKAITLGIRIIHIFQYELDSDMQKEKIFSFLDRILNDRNEIIYARKTKVVYIDKYTEQAFLDKGHLQGYVQSSIKLGLQYNNEIVAIMTFGRPRFNSGCDYELIRLAYKPNTVVIGGADKLFKYFIKTYKPESVISYCDITKFVGNTYTKLGFMTSLTDVTSPNYVWYNPETKVALPRYRTMKHKLLASGIGHPDMTESEIMQSIGYTKVCDCGNMRFIWLASELDRRNEE